MPNQTTLTKSKRMYPPGTFRARPRRPDLKKKTITDIAYSVTRQVFKNHDRDFIKFIKALFLDYLNAVTENILSGHIFNIPMRLGRLYVVKAKSDRAINKKQSHLLQTKVVYKNYHSDGYVMRFKWQKIGVAMFENQGFYSFTPTRAVKRRLFHKIKYEGQTNYAIYSLKDRTGRLHY